MWSKMKREPWHCPNCSQTSTRLWNLRTHIKRRHGAIGVPVRRSTNSIYSDAFVNYTEKITDNRSKDYSQKQPVINPTISARSKPDEGYPFAGLDRAQEAGDKLVEIKRCYSKVYPQDLVQGILKACLDKYTVALDPVVLDCDVVTARKISKFLATVREISILPPESPNIAGDTNAPTNGFINDVLKRAERLIGRSPIYDNNSEGPTTPDPANTDPKKGFNNSSSTSNSSSSSLSATEERGAINSSDFFVSVGNDYSGSPGGFMPYSTRASPDPTRETSTLCKNSAIPSPTRKDSKQSTTGESPSQQSASADRPRGTRRKKSHPTKAQVTSRKLTEFETVLSKFLCPLDVERLVTECRDHARTHGHTGLVDDLLKSASVISRLRPSNFDAVRSQT